MYAVYMNKKNIPRPWNVIYHNLEKMNMPLFVAKNENNIYKCVSVANVEPENYNFINYLTASMSWEEPLYRGTTKAMCYSC